MSKPHPSPNHDPHRGQAAGGRVVVAGVGLITPLGMGAWPTFRALLEGRSISDRTAALPDGLPPTDLALAIGGVSAARHTATDPAVELAERAAREAAAMANVPAESLGLWLGTSKGAVARLSTRLGMGLPLDEQCQETIALGPHGYLAHQLARRLGATPQRQHVAACASGLVALDAARRHLAFADGYGQAQYALVVTADAALTPAFVHSYLRLGVLADPTPDGYRQRPLDHRRRGFMLSELGAAVLLRKLPVGQAPRAGEIELVHTATACEADHMIHSSPAMPALEHVAQQLATSLPAGQPLDVLHPHAPGTPEHDPVELDVLQSVFGESPRLYACKGAIGHGLGSAGLASLVIAALAIRTRQVPPMPWLDQPIFPLRDPAPLRRDRPQSHAVFAAGFGGHTAGALLRA